MTELECCVGEVCQHCKQLAEIWSRKKDSNKEFWCSHSCILKFRGQYVQSEQKSNTDNFGVDSGSILSGTLQCTDINSIEGSGQNHIGN